MKILKVHKRTKLRSKVKKQCLSFAENINFYSISGVSKNFRRHLTIDKFRKAIKSCQQFSVELYTLRSKKHAVTLSKMKKIAFSSFDEKFSLTSCSTHSYP